VLPEDLPVPLSLAVLDVCGAPALTQRVVRGYPHARVLVLGAAGKSGALALAAARAAGAERAVGLVPDEQEAGRLREAGLADEVVLADARDPVAVAQASAAAFAGAAADVTVVCVDVAGCEGGAILATATGGTVVFFSMATSFAAAALGAEGVAADVTMLVGNGYAPGHADLALNLLREQAGLRRLFEQRLDLELSVHP
jgi:L-erythro-3,5-diaminohexanoate dehydrogenase